MTNLKKNIAANGNYHFPIFNFPEFTGLLKCLIDRRKDKSASRFT